MQCEMCGKETVEYFKTRVGGTVLNVCMSCAGYGNVLQQVRPEVKKEFKTEQLQKPAEPEIVEELVEGYAEKIKNKREKLGLKQDEFAQKISEKESIIQKVESGHFTPSIELAKKIERFTGLKLIEEVEDAKVVISQKRSNEGFSLGDFVKVRKK